MERLEEHGAGQLRQVVAAWLEEAWGSVQSASDGRLLLHVNLLDLAASQRHPQVVDALLRDPGARGGCREARAPTRRHRPPPLLLVAEVVRQAAISVLEEAGALPTGHRLLLRPCQLMAAAELSVSAALRCVRCAPGALISCHGACVAATAPFQQPAIRAFRCACCARVCTLHTPCPPPPCCGGELAEVEQSRVMVQVCLGWAARRGELPPPVVCGVPVGCLQFCWRRPDGCCQPAYRSPAPTATPCAGTGGVPGCRRPATRRDTLPKRWPAGRALG